MFTASGRFQPDKKICFSMSDFHPGTWNPAWSVATILTGLLSFMLSDEMTTGSVTSAERDKRILATRSHDWNRKHKRFQDAFPEYCDEQMKDLPNMGERDCGVPSNTSTSSTTTPPSDITIPHPSATTGATTVAALTGTPARALATLNPGLQRAAAPVPPIKATTGTVPTSSATSGTAVTAPVPPIPAPRPGWSASWREAIWDKWRWGILIVLAISLSRLSSL